MNARRLRRSLARAALILPLHAVATFALQPYRAALVTVGAMILGSRHLEDLPQLAAGFGTASVALFIVATGVIYAWCST
jgi:hypothetical protein